MIREFDQDKEVMLAGVKEIETTYADSLKHEHIQIMGLCETIRDLIYTVELLIKIVMEHEKKEEKSGPFQRPGHHPEDGVLPG